LISEHDSHARGAKWGAEQSRLATGQTEIPGAGLVRTATGFSLHDRSHVLGGCEHALPLSGLRWRTRRASSDPGARSSLARRQYAKALMAFVGVVKSGAAFLEKSPRTLHEHIGLVN